MTTIYRVRCPHLDLRSATEPKGGTEFPCSECERGIPVERWEMKESKVWRVYNEHGEPREPDFDTEEQATNEAAEMMDGDEESGVRVVPVTKRTLRRAR